MAHGGRRRGIFIQQAWPKFDQVKSAGYSRGGLSSPLEAKVNCVWGRCYLLRFENDFSMGFGFRDGRMERSSWHADFSKGPLLRSFMADIPRIDEHMRAVFALAERNAQNLKIDFIRVDIFLNPNDPSKPAINEHSIYEVDGLLQLHGKYGGTRP